jgi:hypothetical protein
MERPLIWVGVGMIALGVVAIGLGLLMGAVGRGGRLLPGDIVISRPGLVLAFPLGTSIALSILLTLVLWLVSLARR